MIDGNLIREKFILERSIEIENAMKNLEKETAELVDEQVEQDDPQLILKLGTKKLK